MLGRFVLPVGAVCAVCAFVPAEAAPRHRPIAIRAGPLSSALHELARQAEVELLFDEASVRRRSAPAVRGTMTAEAALGRLLSGTGLGWRRTASGALLVAPAATAAQPGERPLAEEPPVPEILIIGRRTQNTDIRRRETDVQPYQVSTGRQIVEAHRDDLDQYFQSRVTSNTQVISPSLLDNGETVSEIDLRGLGSDGTLVLVDGRRMPSVPGWTDNFKPGFDAVPFGFRQADLNAIPLHAIERVETLTGTAGGIYGFGALGGVVNVVLRRDYSGLELHGTTGVTSRGDARRASLEGSFGFTPNGGRTAFMLSLSHSRSEPLLVGDRTYATRDMKQRFRFAPDQFFFLAPRGGDSVAAISLFGEPLSLKPDYGGQQLGAPYTFLPTGFRGSAAEMGQSLAARAGQIDLSLGEPQASTELGSTRRSTSMIANVRHRFGTGLEGYFDALVLSNHGRHVSRDASGLMLLFDDSPINPFDQNVWVTFPIPDNLARREAKVTTSRYAAGLVADLRFGWRGTAEVTYGSTRADVLRDQRSSSNVFLGPPFGPDVNPFGDWDEFQREIVMDVMTRRSTTRARNRYRQQSLRLAGPLFRTAGGPVALSLLAERRRERVPAFNTILRIETESGDLEAEIPTAPRSNATTSFYGELQAQLIGSRAPFPLVRQLELQLALRHDRLAAVFARDPTDPLSTELGRRVFHGTSFTVGAKSLPTPWLMLRGSYATGAQPPPLELLIPREEVSDFIFARDPRRGDVFLFQEGPVLYKSEGSLGLKTARANTLSVGGVLNPGGRRGPRLSVDYSLIRKSRDAMKLFDPQFILAHEDFWPERVARAPMTDADVALGYTGGRVTMIDARALNAGGARVESIDARFEWPLPLMGGELRLYGAATWQMSNRQLRLFEPSLERAGFRRGPLEWRANGGADWSIGRTTIGANAQFFSHYRIYEQVYGPLSTDAAVQGSYWVRSQAYLDLHASHRFRLPRAGPARDLTVDLGVVNLFDRPPPRETGYPVTGPGYSRYGDPRRRRFEVVLSSEF